LYTQHVASHVHMVVPSTYCFQYYEGDLLWGLVLVCNRDYKSSICFFTTYVGCLECYVYIVSLIHPGNLERYWICY